MKQWLVGTDSGILLVSNTDFTTEINRAALFDKIGDAMKECIRLNKIDFGWLSKFKVIPIE